MAQIENNTLDETVLLNSHHVFGRNKQTTNTYISENDISRSHATIFWKSNNWYIRDHSRNGTLVNGKYINNSTLKLSAEDKIQFGRNESTCWVLKDISSPMSYLKSLTNKNKILSLSSLFNHPNGKDHDVSIYFDNDMKWKAEISGNIIILEHGTVFNFNNEDWMFIENIGTDETFDCGHIINQAYFQFNLSADEERINVKIITNNIELDLGERVHNYLLLALVRKKLADIQMGYVLYDQGWVDIDELVDNMTREFRKKIDAYSLNLQIHRLRKQLIDLEPYGYLFSNIIERRKGKIRFGHKFFQVVKEERVIDEILATT